MAGAKRITATLLVYGVGDAPARVAVLGAAPSSGAVDPTDRPVTVDPGRSAALTLDWQVQDCAATEAVRWPSLLMSVTVPTSTATNSYGLDQTFGTAWHDALDRICGPRSALGE